jgi:hypothetical protein
MAAITDVAWGSAIVMEALTRTSLVLNGGMKEDKMTRAGRLRPRGLRGQAQWAVLMGKAGWRKRQSIIAKHFAEGWDLMSHHLTSLQ